MFLSNAVETFLNRPPNCPECGEHIGLHRDVCTSCEVQFNDNQMEEMKQEATKFWLHVGIWFVSIMLLASLFSAGI